MIARRAPSIPPLPEAHAFTPEPVRVADHGDTDDIARAGLHRLSERELAFRGRRERRPPLVEEAEEPRAA